MPSRLHAPSALSPFWEKRVRRRPTSVRPYSGMLLSFELSFVIFDVTTSHTALIVYRTLEAFYVASVVSSHRYTPTRLVRSKMWFGFALYQLVD